MPLRNPEHFGMSGENPQDPNAFSERRTARHPSSLDQPYSPQHAHPPCNPSYGHPSANRPYSAQPLYPAYPAQPPYYSDPHHLPHAFEPSYPAQPPYSDLRYPPHAIEQTSYYPTRSTRPSPYPTSTTHGAEVLQELSGSIASRVAAAIIPRRPNIHTANQFGDSRSNMITVSTCPRLEYALIALHRAVRHLGLVALNANPVYHSHRLLRFVPLLLLPTLLPLVPRLHPLQVLPQLLLLLLLLFVLRILQLLPLILYRLLSLLLPSLPIPLVPAHCQKPTNR